MDHRHYVGSLRYTCIVWHIDLMNSFEEIYRENSALNFVELERARTKEDISVVPIFHGDVNAFVVEIFAVREDIGNRGTREFLEAAFECFPDLDYCALLLPSAYSYFSFLELFVVDGIL